MYITGIKEKVITEACKLGVVNDSLSSSGPINGSSVINTMLYYFLGPILNMDVLTSEQNQEIAQLLKNETEPDITEIVDLVKKVSPRCSDYLLKCLWNSVLVNCTDVCS